MLLQKINWARLKQLWGQRFTWVGFTLLILSLTTAFASLDLANYQHIEFIDMTMTVGFLVFTAMFDALLVTTLLVILQALLEWIIRKPVEIYFRMALFVGLLASLINMAVLILNRKG